MIEIDISSRSHAKSLKCFNIVGRFSTTPRRVWTCWCRLWSWACSPTPSTPCFSQRAREAIQLNLNKLFNLCLYTHNTAILPEVMQTRPKVQKNFSWHSVELTPCSTRTTTGARSGRRASSTTTCRTTLRTTKDPLLKISRFTSIKVGNVFYGRSLFWCRNINQKIFIFRNSRIRGVDFGRGWLNMMRNCTMTGHHQ